LLGKYIRAHSEAKVIFNGDGSDELMGGYLYMKKAPDALEFDRECRRLLSDIYAFDVLRSDKSISSHGLEPRTPFLDRTWVQYYLSIPATLRVHVANGYMEKWLARSAFSAPEGAPALLPSCVLWRQKEAFSDGVSGQARSLYEILQEFANAKYGSEGLETPMSVQMTEHLPPTTCEQRLYRELFETWYGGRGRIVPYFWMPKYVEATDASARTLEVYSETGMNAV
jgi:asparagine synthase (glutamine-hydrolysing)